MLFDEKEKKQISISTVLNIMDGLAKKNRLISIMTTNHYDHLSDVFKRPGRIDMSVEFNISDLEIFNQILDFLCTYKNESVKDEYRKLIEDFYNNIKHMNPSCALVQKFIFENRKKTIEEIFSKKMITKFKELNIIYQNNPTEKKGISLYA
jgi:SpoVK/Ycf46/Vps4 family AAA+-type ATPase